LIEEGEKAKGEGRKEAGSGFKHSDGLALQTALAKYRQTSSISSGVTTNSGGPCTKIISKYSPSSLAYGPWAPPQFHSLLPSPPFYDFLLSPPSRFFPH